MISTRFGGGGGRGGGASRGGAHRLGWLLPSGWRARDAWPSAGAHKRSLGRSRSDAQTATRVIDSQGAIQALMHLDPGVCITAALGVCPNLQTLPAKAHHIVPSDNAPVLKSEEHLRLTLLVQRTIRT